MHIESGRVREDAEGIGMSFGSLVCNEKGVPHGYVSCRECRSYQEKPLPMMYTHGRSDEGYVREYHCPIKNIDIDDLDEARMCSYFKKESDSEKENREKKEWYVTFSGTGSIVVMAKDCDSAAEIAEDTVDCGDFSDLEIIDVEPNM